MEGDARGVSPKTRGTRADPTLIPRRVPKGGPHMGGCSSVPPETWGRGPRCEGGVWIQPGPALRGDP